MNVDVKFEILEDFPIDKINKYVDLTVFGIARRAQDYATSELRVPKRTGNLEMATVAQPIRKENDGVYCLDVPNGAEYAKYVWEMPQSTNWTNPNTYAQWFVAIYKEKGALFTVEASNDALRSVK